MRRTLVLAAVLAAAGLALPALTGVGPAAADLVFSDHDEETEDPPPPVVLAHIDTGVNPYHEAFQTDLPRAQDHPSEYLEGYPEDAQALDVSLDVDTVEEGLQADADVWDDVEEDTLYYVPGTRIVGLVSLGSGGTSCSYADPPPASYVGPDCEDRTLLDDHGHGTMTASRMAGENSSLSPEALVVSIESLGGESVEWAADQPWIDAQSNSWVSFTPPPANQAMDEVDTPANFTSNSTTTDAFREAADEQLVLAASGNGAAYTQGVAPTPTYVLSTAAPNVTLVGAHDNGYVAQWSGAPAHVVADGYAGPVASHVDAQAWGPRPIACCTSAASPYAAGAAGAIIQEAREILGDDSPGIQDGVVAEGDTDLPDVGPLSDGVFTLEELRTVFYHTAEARPTEGAHDGALHWAADGEPGEWAARYGPGANPFCQGCTTSPVPWTEVPPDAPAHEDIGYGAVSPASVDLAARVLHGHLNGPPDRPAADEWFERDQAVREVLTQDVTLGETAE